MSDEPSGRIEGRGDHCRPVEAGPPPKGWIRANLQEADGTLRAVYLDPKSINRKQEPRSILTEAQKQQITRLREFFRDHDNRPLREWLYDFSCDEHPDREISIYEAMANVYQAECLRRQAQ